MKTDWRQDKDPLAVEGFELGLASVDILLKGLLDEISHLARNIDSRKAAGENPVSLFAPLMRLAIQRQVLEALRAEIPRVILNGDVDTLLRVVG